MSSLEPAYELAYEAALRSLSQQESTVESLRARAGTLVGAIAISTSFLGGAVLRSKEYLDVISGFAVLAFCIATLCCALVISPRMGGRKDRASAAANVTTERGWIFRINPKNLVEDIRTQEGYRLASWHESLATTIGDAIEMNDARIDRLAGWLTAAVISLMFEIAAWVLLLASG